MTVKNYFPGNENRLVDAGGGLTRRVAAYNDNVMCVEVHFETGTVAARHSHPHEQITYVISAGDSLYKQPHIEHGATCIEAGTLLDIFTPHRADFL